MPILSDGDTLKISLTLATLLASTFLLAITSVTSRVSQIRDSGPIGRGLGAEIGDPEFHKNKVDARGTTTARRFAYMYVQRVKYNREGRRFAFIKSYGGGGGVFDVSREHVINFKAGKTARMHRRVHRPTSGE